VTRMILIRHFPYDLRPATVVGHSVSLISILTPQTLLIKPFCDSKIGLRTPGEMVSALDFVPRRFSTER
jgi:hypothetical protein